MTEITNILKEEATCDRTRNYDQRTYSECIKKPTRNYLKSDKHPQFEGQWESVHNLNTVKQTINNITAEKTKPMKQTS